MKRIIIGIIVIIILAAGVYVINQPSPEVKDCMKYSDLDRETCEQQN